MTLPFHYYLLCFWPGWARLWLHGQWRGLAAAVAFALLFNGLLITTFIWPHSVGSAGGSLVFNALAWGAVLCFWGASLWSTWHSLPQLLPGAETRGDDALFICAQTEYLKGEWYLAEKSLLNLLERSPRDADALLLLASLYRRTRRHDEARRRLAQLERLNGGAKWLFEMDEERRRFGRTEDRSLPEETEKSDVPAAQAA